MARFSRKLVVNLVILSRDGATAQERGRSLQDVSCHLLGAIPGVPPPMCNVVDFADGGEIDIFFANNAQDNGLWFLPHAILVECKNWVQPVGSQEVRVFMDRMKERACSVGVLIAANGITGNTDDLSAARRHIARALQDGYHILVVTLDELADADGSAGVVKLLYQKWTLLKTFLSSV